MSERETHKTPTRRVLDTTEDNVWARIEEEAERESYGADGIDLLTRRRADTVKKKKKKKKPVPKKNVRKKETKQRDMAPDSVRMRYQKRQKARRRYAARVHAFLALLAAAIIIAAVLLVTPVFDIRSISVSGNELVSVDEISEKVGDMKGTNLFRASVSDIENRLKTLKYINSISVTKTLIPPSIDIAVTEHKPAGYIQSGTAILVLDKDIHIIEETDKSNVEGLPCIIGVKIKQSKAGGKLIAENADIGSAVETMLRVFEQCGETGNVISADFSNVSNITFNYQNRITGICGSVLNMDKKLRLFCETVNNEEISPDARGTIDLSTTGTAIYDP